MNLRSKRKLNWLEKTGGDEAIAALGSFVEKASEYATNNNIPYKEHGENEDMNQDILDNVTLDIDAVSKDDSILEDVNIESIATLTETEDIATTEKEDTIVEPNVEVETENVITETEVSKDERLITFKELDETIETFVNEVFSPLMEIVKELREQNATLTERLDTLQSNANVIKEVKEDLEVIPTASVASLIKERVLNKLDGMVVTKESVADSKLTEQKPVENIVKENEHFFNDFVNGL